MTSPLKQSCEFKSGKILKDLFPPKSIVETYLLYSGVLELGLSQNDRMVIAHTSKYPVYEFWWTAKQAPERIAQMAEEVYATMEEELVPALQENWHTYRDPVYRSALFFILNRCSTQGVASCGSFDRSGFNPLAMSRMRKLDTSNLYVLLDNDEALDKNINTDVKSDFKFFPVGTYTPNLLDRNFTHVADLSRVHHQRLFNKLKGSDFKWVVLYKKHKAVLKALGDYNLILVNKYGHPTQNIEACEEVLIANF